MIDNGVIAKSPELLVTAENVPFKKKSLPSWLLLAKSDCPLKIGPQWRPQWHPPKPTVL